jgi:hypothetical protein
MPRSAAPEAGGSVAERVGPPGYHLTLEWMARAFGPDCQRYRPYRRLLV